MYSNESQLDNSVSQSSGIENYILESMEATNMKFICKVCNEGFQTSDDVKQHIMQAHDNSKRKRDNNDESTNILPKKPLLMPENSDSQAEDSLADTDAFCINLLGDVNVSEEATFIDISFTNENAVLHSTLNIEESNSFNEGNDILTLRTKLMSLEVDLKNKAIVINEKKNELSVAKSDIKDCNEMINSQRENLEIALAKIKI